MIRALIAGAVLVVAAATLVVAGGGNSQPASQHSGQPVSRHSVPPPDPLLAFTARAGVPGTGAVIDAISDEFEPPWTFNYQSNLSSNGRLFQRRE